MAILATSTDQDQGRIPTEVKVIVTHDGGTKHLACAEHAQRAARILISRNGSNSPVQHSSRYMRSNDNLETVCEYIFDVQALFEVIAYAKNGEVMHPDYPHIKTLAWSHADALHFMQGKYPTAWRIDVRLVDLIR